MYSAFKLNKQSDNIVLMYSFSTFEPVCCSMYGSNCCFLTCKQVLQETGNVVWYSHLLKNFYSLLWSMQSKALSSQWSRSRCLYGILLFFYDPTNVGNLISGSSVISKSSLNIWKFLVHVLLKSHWENFEHYFASMWNECNCVVAWTFFGIAFLWDWNANRPFSVLWLLLSFPNLLACCTQHFNSTIF